MKRQAVLVSLLTLGVSLAGGTEDELFDRIDETLTFASPSGEIRTRLSGTLELEGYRFTQPAPALIDAEGTELFNPRLVAFADVQAGPAIYAFAQVRFDSGFDPAADPLRARVDEYALRVTPWLDGRMSVQVGKFAAVFGNWIARHGTWENPFISAPLPYENQTGIWDSVAARSAATLLAWAHVRPRVTDGEPARDKYLRLPVLWGPSYAPGVSVSGAVGQLEYAAEIKAVSLSARPTVWDDLNFHWRHPTLTSRLGYRPNLRWNFGASASVGSYLTPEAAPTLPAGLGLGDYRQIVLGQDVSFAWHHVQLWAEVIEARFKIPQVGDAATWSYYVEAKYKFTAEFFGAVRWNEQFFGSIPDGSNGRVRWGGDVWRVDLAPSYRLTAHAEVKFQCSLEHDALRDRRYSQLWATQLVLRF